MKTYLIVSSLLIFLSTGFFLATVLLRRRLSRRILTFSGFALSVMLWAFSHMMWQLSPNPAAAAFWCRLLVYGSAFIPITYLDFVSGFLRQPPRRTIAVGYLLAVLTCAANAAGLVFSELRPILGFPFWPRAGLLFPLYFGFFALYVAISFVILLREFRRSSPQVRNQLQYMIIGTAVGFAGGSTNFPLWMDLPVPPFGNGLGLFYIFGIGYSVVKYRLLEFNEVAFRLVAGFVFVVGLSWLGSLITFPLARASLGIALPSAFYPYWTIVFTLTLALFLLVPFTNRLFDKFLEWVGPSPISRQTALKSLVELIGKAEDEPRLFAEFVSELARLIPLQRLALYYRSDLEHHYGLRASRLPESTTLPAVVEPESISDVLQRLVSTRQGLLIAEMTWDAPGLIRLTPNPWTNSGLFLADDLLIPFLAEKSVDGFLILGPRTDRRIFRAADIALLENLCGQLALSLRSRQIERRANQMEKLVSLGTLAAGLAHELRNPLVSIKTLGSLLQLQPAQIPVEPEFTRVVQRDINRISSIIENVATFAANASTTSSEVEIDEIFRRTLEILRHRLDQAGITLDYQPSDTPPVLGNFNQLIQVFFNILENALHALENAPVRRLTLRHRVILRGDRDRWVEVTVSDTGPGIAPELLPRIFDPFITTKNTGTRTGHAGTGLGLAIVKRIIDAHHGTIEAESKPGEGSRFRLCLPAAR